MVEDICDVSILDANESNMNEDEFISALKKVNPDIVFTHHCNDISNADHRVISNIVLDMSFLIVAKNIITKHKETKKSPAFYYIDVPGGVNFEPNEFVDISDVIDEKKKSFSFSR